MTKTVLIVEDNELNMKLFEDLLQNYGYNTRKATSGSEALQSIRCSPPDLIIMDVQIPEISGTEVIAILKNDAALCSIPILAVTAFAMKGDEERIRKSGCDDYLAKPISISLFIDRVRIHLRDKAA
jgi:two-component system cell cycle response regulator DivK